MEIVVLDRGWVYAVDEVLEGQQKIVLEGARCIRRWGTTNGLAQLANEGPQPETKLEPRCTVKVQLPALVHRIACSEAAWRGK